MWQDKSHLNYRAFKEANARKDLSPNPAGVPPKSAARQRKIQCSHCGYEQFVLEEALSVFCKNCNKRITLGAPSRSAPQQKASVTHHLRAVSCPKCEAQQQVPHNALSSFCQKCGNRINLQDYEIKGKFNGELNTKGTLVITISGDVHADVTVGNAVIEGKLVGKILCDGMVELKSTAKLYGDVIAAHFIVNDGALFVGHSLVPPTIRQPA
jgi:hypothetical protein